MESLPSKFLVLIDILGFSDLIIKRGRVDEVYEIIDTLNAHTHPSFKTTVFSDTILISGDYSFREDQTWGILMWLCEFPQELFYRLMRFDLHFRAYIKSGEYYNKNGKHPGHLRFRARRSAST